MVHVLHGTCIAKKDASKVEAFKNLVEIGFRKATSKTMKTGQYKKLDKVLCMYVHCDCFVLDM